MDHLSNSRPGELRNRSLTKQDPSRKHHSYLLLKPLLACVVSVRVISMAVYPLGGVLHVSSDTELQENTHMQINTVAHSQTTRPIFCSLVLMLHKLMPSCYFVFLTTSLLGLCVFYQHCTVVVCCTGYAPPPTSPTLSLSLHLLPSRADVI